MQKENQNISDGAEDPEIPMDWMERTRYGHRPLDVLRNLTWDGGSKLTSLPNSAAREVVEENYSGTVDD